MLLFKEMNVSNQKELIEKTVRDYIEGFYGMDPERMRHALHPKLVKRRPNQENLETGFDELTAEQLAVSQAELVTASLKADESLRATVADAQRNIAAFARKSRRRDWQMRNSHGAIVGEKFDPFQRVGIYIPGGTAPLVSTALMTVTLAKVAGCPEIVVCTPCGKEGSINPAVLFAARAAGATEIYRVGGAQAIAAMAYGTSTIRRVQKIFGPGNAYVVAAKRLVFGHVAIDLLPGPSELLVVADDTARIRVSGGEPSALGMPEHRVVGPDEAFANAIGCGASTLREPFDGDADPHWGVAPAREPRPRVARDAWRREIR